MNAAAGTTTDDVVALLAVVPDRYHAAIHLGAGEGVRLGEVLGFEDGSRCLDPNHSEIHVVHRGPAQSVTSICQTSPLAYRPQGRSRGFAPWRSCSPTTRGARSTTNVGRTCGSSGARQPAGPTRRPSTPCATMLISAGADPTDVQRALRHSSLRITLETYVHGWPKKQRRRNVAGTALRNATQRIRDSQDRP